jgi:hypothetical protein
LARPARPLAALSTRDAPFGAIGGGGKPSDASIERTATIRIFGLPALF